MSVWLAIPSKRPPEQVEPLLKLWRERGYRVALWVDGAADMTEFNEHGVNLRVMQRHYPGYAVACNALIGLIIRERPDVEWIVTGGDDGEPDPNHSAEEVARQCAGHFSESAYYRKWAEGGRFGSNIGRLQECATFGVMQPTGDRWGEHAIEGAHDFTLWPDQPKRCMICGQGRDAPKHYRGAYIDRVCGSPWLGREFCRRMYGGNGPYWPEYTHMGVDEELQHVAMKLGVLWQRPELTHYHRHWGRAPVGQKYGSGASMPEFLQHANTAEEWARYKRIFNARLEAGFPGHEPLT